MSGTCSLFPPFGDPWPSCLLPSQTPLGFPDGASGKESVCGCRRLIGGEGSVLGLGRSPAGRSCTPPQYSCLEDPTGSGPGSCCPWGCRDLEVAEHTNPTRPWRVTFVTRSAGVLLRHFTVLFIRDIDL